MFIHINMYATCVIGVNRKLDAEIGRVSQSVKDIHGNLYNYVNDKLVGKVFLFMNINATILI